VSAVWARLSCALCLGVAACAGGASRGAPVAAPVTAVKSGPSFAAWEKGWLDELGATDMRIALRMRIPPSKEVVERAASEAVVRGDEGLGVLGGAIDVFSWKTREVRLGKLREELGKAPDDGSEESRGEKALLGDLLEGEQARLVDEGVLGISASDRVRAIVATWGHPSSLIEVEQREHEVVRGLLDVSGDVVLGQLKGPRITELEDALDPLERLAVPAGYPQATKALTFLRVELGKAHSTPGVTRGPLLFGSLAVHLGSRDKPETLLLKLEGEEASLRKEATAALAALGDEARVRALESAAVHVQEETPCDLPTSPSPARALLPPPERALLCSPLHLAASASIRLDAAIVAVTLHDDVAIALWALALDHGRPDLDVARLAHPLIAPVSTDRRDRLARSALVSPVRAIAVGLMASLLDEAGLEHRRDRAKAWVAWGDGPLDTVGEYLRHLP